MEGGTPHCPGLLRALEGQGQRGRKIRLPGAGRALGMGFLGWASGPEKRLVGHVTKSVKVPAFALVPARARVGEE